MINLNNVSVYYQSYSDRVFSLKEFIIKKMQGKIKVTNFVALDRISVSIQKGEIIGIIGKNGAGKSTLLKVVSGIIKPTKGSSYVNGSIIPLLELGAGFDYELTGRENIYLYGALLGYSETFIRQKYDEIVNFSEIWDFIESPIRNYSSGMIVRLAFSIATIMKPEILIVDEVLAVGDENFQKKSKNKMMELMKGGATVLFVSHNVNLISEICDKVLWLENGKVVDYGDPIQVCKNYISSF